MTETAYELELEKFWLWATRPFPGTNNYVQMAELPTQAQQEGKKKKIRASRKAEKKEPKVPKEKKEKAVAEAWKLTEDGIQVWVGPNKGVYLEKITKNGNKRKIYLDHETLKPKKSLKRKAAANEDAPEEEDDVQETPLDGTAEVQDVEEGSAESIPAAEMETKVTIRQRPKKRQRRAPVEDVVPQ